MFCEGTIAGEVKVSEYADKRDEAQELIMKYATTKFNKIVIGFISSSLIFCLNEGDIDMENVKQKWNLKTLFMNYSVYIVLIVLVAYFSLANADFLSTYNVENFLSKFRQ